MHRKLQNLNRIIIIILISLIKNQIKSYHVNNLKILLHRIYFHQNKLDAKELMAQSYY